MIAQIDEPTADKDCDQTKNNTRYPTFKNIRKVDTCSKGESCEWDNGISYRSEEFCHFVIQVSKNHTGNDRNQRRHKAHNRNISKSRSAKRYQCQEWTVIDCQNRHTCTVNIVPVCLHQCIINTAVTVCDRTDDCHT